MIFIDIMYIDVYLYTELFMESLNHMKCRHKTNITADITQAEARELQVYIQAIFCYWCGVCRTNTFA